MRTVTGDDQHWHVRRQDQRRGQLQPGLDPAQYVTRKDFLDALELRPTRDQVETQIAGVRTDAANTSASRPG